jgi:obg-like ATPase 1
LLLPDEPRLTPVLSAPKGKKAEPEKKILLGRPGNNLKIGIVGVPNVGKSSFFNLLSKTQLSNAANFPYATM